MAVRKVFWVWIIPNDFENTWNICAHCPPGADGDHHDLYENSSNGLDKLHLDLSWIDGFGAFEKGCEP